MLQIIWGGAFFHQAIGKEFWVELEEYIFVDYELEHNYLKYWLKNSEISCSYLPNSQLLEPVPREHTE